MQVDKSRGETILKAMIGKGWLTSKEISVMLPESFTIVIVSMTLREYMKRKTKPIFLYRQYDYNQHAIWLASHVACNVETVEECRYAAVEKKKLIAEKFTDKGWFRPADHAKELDIQLQKFGIYLHQMQEKEYGGLSIESRDIQHQSGRKREWRISTSSETSLYKKYTQLLRSRWI